MSDQLKPIIEALVFASPEPLTIKTLFKLLEDEPQEDVEAALAAVEADYDRPGGLQLVKVAGGFQIVTRPELHEWVRRLFHERSTQKLTVQSLETLAVVAYRQPVTAPEVSEIRGVNTSGVLSTLIERRLIKVVGRKKVIGRPFLYATTQEFLIRFGLSDLKDLPNVEDMAEAFGLEIAESLAETSTAEDEPLPVQELGDAPRQQESVEEAAQVKESTSDDNRASIERPMPSPKVRLQKVLASAGISSRRAAERLIEVGRVTVNGRSVTKLGAKADPDLDDIRVDGRKVITGLPRIYLLVCKPRGYVTTRFDPEGRRTILDLISNVREYVYPVGRLDYDSEGLVILTNDGTLAARLTHPRYGVERVYEVRVRGVPSQAAIDSLRRGVVIDGRRTASSSVKFLRRLKAKSSENALLRVAIREGKNRQVRKMCEAIGHPVIRLRRTQIGPLRDSSLKVGKHRLLTNSEIAALVRASEVSHSQDKMS